MGFRLSALCCAGLLLVGADATAQCRVEGIVRWADGTPAATIAISIPELTLQTETDAAGRFAFGDIRPGIRITVDAFLDKRLLGRAYTLVTLAVEHVDLRLAGTPSNPTPPPGVPPELTRQETRRVSPDVVAGVRQPETRSSASMT